MFVVRTLVGKAIGRSLTGLSLLGFFQGLCHDQARGGLQFLEGDAGFEPWKTQFFFAFSICKVNPLATLAALTFKNSRFFAFFFGPRCSFVGSAAFFFWKT